MMIDDIDICSILTTDFKSLIFQCLERHFVVLVMAFPRLRERAMKVVYPAEQCV